MTHGNDRSDDDTSQHRVSDRHDDAGFEGRWSQRDRSTDAVERRLDDVLETTRSVLLSNAPAVPGDELRRLIGVDPLDRSASPTSRNLTMLNTDRPTEPTPSQSLSEAQRPSSPVIDRRSRLALLASVAAACIVVVGGAMALRSSPQDGDALDPGAAATGGEDLDDEQPDPTSALHDDDDDDRPEDADEDVDEDVDDRDGRDAYDDDDNDDDDDDDRYGDNGAAEDGSPAADLAVRWIEVADAGRVLIGVVDGRPVVESTEAAPGWVVVEEAGDEPVDLSFRRGDDRVDVDVEIEHGTARLRIRDRRTGERVETNLDGTPVRDHHDESYEDDDSSEYDDSYDRDSQDGDSRDGGGDDADDLDEDDDRDAVDDGDAVDDRDDAATGDD